MSVSAIGGGNSAWYTQAQTQPAQPEMTNTAQLFDMSSSQGAQQLPSSQLQGMATNIANGTAPAGGHHHGGHHHGMGMDAAQLLDSSSDTSSTSSTSSTATSQDGAPQLALGQALTSLLAAGAYAGSASESAASTSANSQVDQYI
jgi:hypothetical protein